MHPLADVLEGLSISDIVHDDDAVSPSVVRGCERPEPLLTGRVPYLQLDVLPVQLDRFDFEVHAYRVEKVLVERVFLRRGEMANKRLTAYRTSRQLFPTALFPINSILNK